MPATALAQYTTGVSIAKTLRRGMSKSRVRSPSIGIDRLYKQSMYEEFFTTLKTAVVSDFEALDAAKIVSEPTSRRIQRYATGAAIGAGTSPVVTLAGNVAGALGTHAKDLATPGRRGAAVLDAARLALTRPQLAKDVARGVVTGAGVQAIREGVQRQQAKKTVTSYLSQQPKIAKRISKPELRKMFAEDYTGYASEPGDD